MSNISSKISSIEALDDVNDSEDRLNSVLIHRSEKPKYDQGGDKNAPLPLDRPLVPRLKKGPGAPSFTWVNLTIGLAIILWVVCVGLVVYTSRSSTGDAFALTGLDLASLTLLVLGPVFILLILGYALKQLARLSQQAHALSVTTQQLMSPDETAFSRSSIMSRNIKGEINEVNASLDKAVSRMANLKETLEEQIQSIDRVSYLAENKTELIASQLSEERKALSEIASVYDDRMAALTAGLEQHSVSLATATKEAEQKINEARISVEGAAAKINAASETVLQNTNEASSKLDANEAAIMRLADELKIRSTELDGLYSHHAKDLDALITELRTEQETLAVSLEAGLKKMRDMSLTAQVSTKHLTDASTAGRKAVVALADAARLTDSAVKQRFADMEEMVRFSNARAESISEKAARRVQDSLAQTRKEISRIEYDMVELQDRLKFSPSKSEAPAPQPEPRHRDTQPSAPAPAPAPRRGLSGFKPLPDDDAEVESRSPGTATEETPATSSSAASHKRRLAGLRPAPEQTETFSEPYSTDEVAALTLPTQADTEANLVIPDIAGQIESAPAEDEHALILQIPDEDDFKAVNPHEDLTGFDPDFLRPSDTSDKKKDGKNKSWWKSLFSNAEDANDEALDALTAPSGSPQFASKPSDEVSNEDIVAALTAIGLSPAAIVDDGCIIEAVNTRISRGPLAMSDVITNRLEDPVRHLFDQAQQNSDLRADMTSFARRFHTSLGAIEDDREAIRHRFESDAGRAFLLCDAALNR